VSGVTVRPRLPGAVMPDRHVDPALGELVSYVFDGPGGR
jgi:hypothetical protein